MRIKNLFLATGLLVSAGALAQSVPTHPNYINYGTDNNQRFTTEFVKMLETWEPGKPYLSPDDPEYSNYTDDNFFISRVRVKDRITNTATQANPNLVPGEEAVNEKKLCWFSPIGEMTKQWSAMSRYTFESDNFSMWQYLDIHSNVSSQLFRSPGVFNDAAHKNGVLTAAYYFIDWASSVTSTSDAGKPLYELSKKENGKFKYAKKLIQLMKYYGIDGMAFNPEGYFSSDLNTQFQEFLAECHRIAEEEENWHFHVDWYGYVSNSGNLTDGGSTLTANHSNWFHNDALNYPVTDVYFLNYNWSEGSLQTSVNVAKSKKRSPFDVYAGFDQQGRGYGGWGNGGWGVLSKYPVSIVVWGAHDRSQIYTGSNEFGTSELTIQNTYQDKLEMLFTGGTQNVLSAQKIPLNESNEKVTTSHNDLKKWHGYSRFINAKSTLQELPFITRFNLGNGMSFKKEGKVTFNQKWYNISMQDYLPTWRWWVDAGNREVPADAINCDFDFNEAWYGGSSLKFHGATQKSEVNLYKTKFTVESENDKFGLTFMLKNGTDPKLKFKVSLVGSESSYKYYTIPAESVKAGEWNTISFTAADLGLKANDVIATMGLAFENTDANYQINIGELSLIPASYNKTPRAPRIVSVTPCKRTYKAVDFKMTWSMLDEGKEDISPNYPGCPTYNEDVDTWYYEVYIKTEDSEPTLLTATTSWASYVIDAPLPVENTEKYMVGVRAIGLNGSTSEITWSDEQTSEIEIINTISINKPVIKPNEEFTIGFDDPNHAPSTIIITDAITGDEVAKATEVRTLTTKLSELGTYDVEVITGEESTMTRGCLLISPEETGRMPEIEGYIANPTEPKTNEEVTLTPAFNDGTTYQDSPATVSQGAYILNPSMFYVDKQILDNHTTNTFCFWFKSDKFEHGSLGTLLTQKVNKNYSGTWTESTWGEMWCVIRSANYSDYNNLENEISISFDAPPAGTANYEHNNDVDGISQNYPLSANVWNHIAIVKDNRNIKLYINGHEVISTTSKGSGPKDWGANFYIGGALTNTSGFNGYIDEVQLWDKALTAEEVKEAMSGYFLAPEGLQGYFKFEDMEDDGKGNQAFRNEGQNSTLVPYGYIGLFTTENERSVEKPETPTVGLGVPSITGVSNIRLESVEWILEGATHTTDDENVATATYATQGKYPVTLKVTNSWGTTTKTFDDYLEIKAEETGVEKEIVENMYVYPNPFVKDVNLRFANDGVYDIKVYDAQGRLVTGQLYNADKGEICTLSIDNGAGMYYVVVSQNGKCLKSFKVVSQK